MDWIKRPWLEMYVLNCLTDKHDLKYLAAAVFVCCLGSVLLVTFMGRAKSSSGSTRAYWILLSGIVGGSMIWATHFAAMIGYSPSIPHSYDLHVVAGALLFGCVSTAMAVSVFTLEDSGGFVEASGLLIGLGMGGVHLIGMHAYHVQANITWHLPTVLVAMTLAPAFGLFATSRLARPLCRWCRFIAMGCMALAVLSMHFIAMSSMTLRPDPSIRVPVVVMSDPVIMLVIMTSVVLLLACGWIFYHIDAKSEFDAQRRYEHLEHHDPLTGLSNRAGLVRLLDQMIADDAGEGRGLALLYLDIRRFRNVNNVHGYVAGDEMLRVIGRRVSKVCGSDILIGRVGGDEFVAVVRSASVREATRVATLLTDTVSQPVVWRGKPLSVSSNVGIAVYPGDGRTSDILLSRANFALVRARREAVDIAYHDTRREEAIRSKSEIALDLAQAIERGEFELHYQRQNNASTRELVGFEVLLRWNHPEKGLIPPCEFIPIAEAYGYISMIGEWVLRTACTEAASWPKPYKIAVNVAPEQLGKQNLPDIVEEALTQSGLPASRLELEMTESGIVADPEHTRRIIDRLKRMGVGLAMDDYGTGSSSLSTLQNYPFDKIKIDKSFVTSIVSDPQASAIVRSTIILGKSLKIPILAEGVESECAMKFLRRIGCTEVQGFLFGKPQPASAIQELKT